MQVMINQEYQKIIDAIVVPDMLLIEEKLKRYQPLIDFQQKETPEKLYRFRSCSERAMQEFDQDILGFSPASKMNDDFDGLLYFDAERIKSDFIDALLGQKAVSVIEALKQGAVPAGFSQTIPSETIKQIVERLSKILPDELSESLHKFLGYVSSECNRHLLVLSTITRNLKVACLSSAIDSAAMWGYYADGGKGFALSYDLRIPDFSNYCISPVIYDDQRLDATQYAAWLFQLHVIQQILYEMNASALYPLFQQSILCPDNFMCSKVLLHKACCWSHEKEWRLIYYEKPNVSIEYPYVLKRPTALYLGRNISAFHQKVLCQIALEKKIPVYKMSVCESDASYRLWPQSL